jgi:RNA polymerase sigma-70 factor (ECF subfamily)
VSREPPAPADDARLIERLRAGDEEAFRSLVRRHGGALLRFARGFLRDEAAAEEVVQDAWMALLDGLDAFEGRSSLKTWLFRVVANKARTRAVRGGRQVPFSSLEPEAGDEVDPARFDEAGHWREAVAPWATLDPERLALGAETGRALAAAIEALPASQRAVLVLRDVEGLETAEVCQLLGLTEANARVLLHRARTRVRAALEPHLAGEG